VLSIVSYVLPGVAQNSASVVLSSRIKYYDLSQTCYLLCCVVAERLGESGLEEKLPRPELDGMMPQS